jgi:hypothetical protein
MAENVINELEPGDKIIILTHRPLDEPLTLILFVLLITKLITIDITSIPFWQRNSLVISGEENIIQIQKAFHPYMAFISFRNPRVIVLRHSPKPGFETERCFIILVAKKYTFRSVLRLPYMNKLIGSADFLLPLAFIGMIECMNTPDHDKF